MTTATNGAAPLSLPATPNLDHLKKQAKQLLQAFRAREPEALQIIAAFHPKPEAFMGLRDAQFVLARRYGFPDWQQLCEEVEMRRLRSGTLQEQATRFIELACLRYNGDDRAWRYARSTALLQKEPGIAQANFYSALVAGDVPAASAFLARDATLAARSGGPLNWPPLLYLTYGRVPASETAVLGLLQLLLGHGASPDSHVMLGDCRFTALTGAMGEGERGPIDCPPHQHAAALVAALLAAGADPNDSQALYNTMFTSSIERWLPQLIAHGLTARHIANWQPKGNFTMFNFILPQMVAYGKTELVRLLLESGADPNAVNTYTGKSCHTAARQFGFDEIANMLAARGAHIEPLSAADEFRRACWRDDKACAEALLQENPAFTRQAQLFHDVALVDLTKAAWLISRGFDINCRTADGRTVLQRYASLNKPDTIRTLLELGADPALMEPHYGATALGFAIHDRAWDVVPVLLECSTNLLDVCRVVDVDKAQQLLAEDSSRVHLKTPMGNTPLHQVSQAYEEEPDVEASAALIALLLKYGANPQARNKEGLTPQQWFRKRGMDDLAELL